MLSLQTVQILIETRPCRRMQVSNVIGRWPVSQELHSRPTSFRLRGKLELNWMCNHVFLLGILRISWILGFIFLNSWIFSRVARDSAFTDSDKRILFSFLFVGTLFVCLLSDEEIKKTYRYGSIVIRSCGGVTFTHVQIQMFLLTILLCNLIDLVDINLLQSLRVFPGSFKKYCDLTHGQISII